MGCLPWQRYFRARSRVRVDGGPVIVARGLYGNYFLFSHPWLSLLTKKEPYHNGIRNAYGMGDLTLNAISWYCLQRHCDENVLLHDQGEDGGCQVNAGKYAVNKNANKKMMHFAHNAPKCVAPQTKQYYS